VQDAARARIITPPRMQLPTGHSQTAGATGLRGAAVLVALVSVALLVPLVIRAANAFGTDRALPPTYLPSLEGPRGAERGCRHFSDAASIAEHSTISSMLHT
jgi:hypothetical protein